jgi:hypothetical protein
MSVKSVVKDRELFKSLWPFLAVVGFLQRREMSSSSLTFSTGTVGTVIT